MKYINHYKVTPKPRADYCDSVPAQPTAAPTITTPHTEPRPVTPNIP